MRRQGREAGHEGNEGCWAMQLIDVLATVLSPKFFKVLDRIAAIATMDVKGTGIFPSPEFFERSIIHSMPKGWHCDRGPQQHRSHCHGGGEGHRHLHDPWVVQAGKREVFGKTSKEGCEATSRHPWPAHCGASRGAGLWVVLILIVWLHHEPCSKTNKIIAATIVITVIN